jgi:hypothetical protein
MVKDYSVVSLKDAQRQDIKISQDFDKTKSNQYARE